MDPVPGSPCSPWPSCHIWTFGDAFPPSPTEGCRYPDRAPQRDWKWSERALRVQLAESRRQRAELAGRLRVALEALSEQAQVLQRREHKLGLSRAQSELLAQKQKQLECSLACLEQERRPLQGPQGLEDWRSAGQAIEERILLLQAEVERAWRCLDQMSQQRFGPEPTLRELVPGLQVQEQRWDGDGAQVLQDSAGASVGAAEAPAQPQDTAFLQEQLAVVTQVNKRLVEELGQSHQQLGAFREQLQLLQGEQMAWRSRGQALEAERARLLGEKSVLLAALGVAPGQEACTPQVQEVPVTLRRELEAGDSHPRLHAEAAEYWKARRHQVAVALKFKEEELQRLQRQGGVWPPQAPQRPAQDSAGPRASVSRKMGQQLERGPPKPQLRGQPPAGDPDTATERQECPWEEWPARSRVQALEEKNDLMAAETQGWEAHSPAETPGRRPESVSGSPQELPEWRPAGEPESPGPALPAAEGRAQGQAGVQLPRPPPEDLEELSLRRSGEVKGALGLAVQTDRAPEGLSPSSVFGFRDKRKELFYQPLPAPERPPSWPLVWVKAVPEGPCENGAGTPRWGDVLGEAPEAPDAAGSPGPIPPQTSLQEVRRELAQMRAELEKVWDVLRARDSELEAQQRALESAQNQAAEGGATPSNVGSGACWTGASGHLSAAEDLSHSLGATEESSSSRGSSQAGEGRRCGGGGPGSPPRTQETAVGPLPTRRAGKSQHVEVELEGLREPVLDKDSVGTGKVPWPHP
ncbi:coiled-coil domain-containing protein 102A isoform X2 [Dasypus novemcinctus]|uniref:coiled-coil domain-containing protein 102A isoform X2 n=1 Tax=Dasypus novemcinctus TaxID=9361 RepID=UPI00265FCDE1|nr:uncharacterized protein LOC101429923 isoform X2 [Dasypus novemcinctus]